MLTRNYVLISLSSIALGTTPIFIAKLPIPTQLEISAKFAQSFKFVEAKTCKDIDENRRPIDVTSKFPAGTEKVVFEFTWVNAEVNLPVTARWFFTSEDIHILDSNFNLTRRAERGATMLEMPKGKPLPTGNYRVDLEVKGQVVKSATFKVENAPPASSSS